MKITSPGQRWFKELKWERSIFVSLDAKTTTKWEQKSADDSKDFWGTIVWFVCYRYDADSEYVLDSDVYDVCYCTKIEKTNMHATLK